MRPRAACRPTQETAPPRRRTAPRRGGAGAPPSARAPGYAGTGRLAARRLGRLAVWGLGRAIVGPGATTGSRGTGPVETGKSGGPTRILPGPGRRANGHGCEASKPDAAGRCRPAGPDGRSSGGPGPDNRRLRPGVGWRLDDLGPVGGENGTARWWGDPHVRQTSEPRPGLCGSDAGVLRRRRRTHVPHRITNACSLSTSLLRTNVCMGGGSATVKCVKGHQHPLAGGQRDRYRAHREAPGDPGLHRRPAARAGIPAVGPRDRGGGGPDVLLHRAHPPDDAAAPGLPAPRSDQAPGHRSAVRHQLRHRHRSTSRPATSRSSARWRPGTDVLAEQNIEELLPLPEDFTGDGPAVHAQGPGRFHDRRGDPRRRLRRRPPTERGAKRATWWSPASPEARPPSRRTAGAAAKVVLTPANPTMTPMVFAPDEVGLYGKVVTVLRRLAN